MKKTFVERFEELPRNKVVSERANLVREIAEVAKVTEGAVYRWARGEVVPPPLAQDAIAAHFGATVEELFPKKAS